MYWVNFFSAFNHTGLLELKQNVLSLVNKISMSVVFIKTLLTILFNNIK